MCPRCFFVFGARGDRGELCLQCQNMQTHRGDGAARALAAGLIGVCWGMAADDQVHKSIEGTLHDGFESLYERVSRWSKSAEHLGRMVKASPFGWSGRWLLDQARPPGCVAPWEVAP